MFCICFYKDYSNPIVYFIIKRVVYYGFSRKKGRVFSVFGRPRQHKLSLFFSRLNQ
ncbi:hypothetical protein Hanom_Chr13g01226271 [Helianthus anomalus]